MSSSRPSRPEPRPPIPLSPLPDADRGPSPLPAPLAPFVGRADDLAVLRAAIVQPETRLLTLTGPGGVGKTRLALRAAEELADRFPDGVAFVPFAALTDPGQVLPAVARALGLREGGNPPPEQRLVSLLRERRMLILLDNLEHLPAAGPAVAALLEACPGVRVLATSRAPLAVYGERVVPVPPLRLPDLGAATDPPATLDALDASDAVQLFVVRAQAARPDFALTPANADAVAAICRSLDGLPLAIELAAARSAHLSLAAILAHLDRRLPLLTGGPRDQPARLRTMRDAIAWSYDLLSGEEQTAFRRLSVFVGSFAIDEACVVADLPSGVGGGVLGPLGHLLDHSLVQAVEEEGEEPRFRLLNTIQTFAYEELLRDETEAAAAAERHAMTYLALALRAEPALWGPEQGRWLDRLERDLPNLRAARVWFENSGDAANSLNLAVALGRFWALRAYFAEGRDWLDRSLAATNDRHDLPHDRACALYYAAALAYFQGDDGYADDSARACIALCEASNYRLTMSFANYVLALSAQRAGDLPRAEALHRTALDIARAMDDRRITGFCLTHLGRLAEIRGDLSQAATAIDEGLAIQRDNGDHFGIITSLLSAAQIAIERDDRAAARTALAEALTIVPSLRNRLLTAEALEIASRLLIRCGEPERGVRVWTAADRLRTMLGVPVIAYWRARHEASLRDARSALGEDRFAVEVATGQALPIEEAIAEAKAAIAGVETGSPQTPRDFATPLLTPRERDVLRLLVEGRTDKEIAAALFVSPRTATTHVASILAKLGVASRTAAAAVAVRRGIA
jgi:predicted ATPase/DNA-binding CsgD family transcriptional regulator